MAQPLQRTRRNGTLYQRPPPIERAVDEALAQDEVRLLARARLERGDAEYLPSECVVHLCRDARRREDQPRFTRFALELFRRCAANLRATVEESLPAAEEVRDEIMGQLAELFAIDGSDEDKLRLDFYEVKFDRAFSKLRVNAVRAHLTRQKQRKGIEAVARLKPESSEDTDHELVMKISAELVANHLDVLSQDERTAVALRYFEGLEVRSIDPEKPSVSKLTGVSAMTVHKRLRSAEQKLLAVLEGKL